MNRIVREHYPIDKLPEELRELLDPSLPVTLVLEQLVAVHDLGEPDQVSQLTDEADKRSLTQILEEMQSRRVFSDDPVKRVRALRAEWDWRDAFHDRIRTGDAD